MCQEHFLAAQCPGKCPFFNFCLSASSPALVLRWDSRQKLWLWPWFKAWGCWWSELGLPLKMGPHVPVALPPYCLGNSDLLQPAPAPPCCLSPPGSVWGCLTATLGWKTFTDVFLTGISRLTPQMLHMLQPLFSLGQNSCCRKGPIQFIHLLLLLPVWKSQRAFPGFSTRGTRNEAIWSTIWNCKVTSL